MHIKAATSGKAPDCVVMNVTVRSMKLHGGAFGDRGGIRPDKATLEAENVEATAMGARTNLDRHIGTWPLWRSRGRVHQQVHLRHRR